METIQDINANLLSEMAYSRNNKDRFEYFQKLYMKGFKDVEEFKQFLIKNEDVEYLDSLYAQYIGSKIDWKKIFEEELKTIKVNNLILSKTINYYLIKYPELDPEYIKTKIREKINEKTK